MPVSLHGRRQEVFTPPANSSDREEEISATESDLTLPTIKHQTRRNARRLRWGSYVVVFHDRIGVGTWSRPPQANEAHGGAVSPVARTGNGGRTGF